MDGVRLRIVRATMRKADLRLLALARQGDPLARLEVARRYLQGSEGFARHVPTALEHLGHAGLAGSRDAVRLVLQHLRPHELLQHDLMPLLLAHGEDGVESRRHLAAWWLSHPQTAEQGLHLLERAASQQDWRAAAALQQAGEQQVASRAHAAFVALLRGEPQDARALLERRIEDGLARGEVPAAATALALALALMLQPGWQADADALAAWMCRLAGLCIRTRQPPKPLRSEDIEPLLRRHARHGDAQAALLLGRALCGIDAGRLPHSALVPGTNLRLGVALLMRAADGGLDEAWRHLVSVHSEHRSSVANPQLARFFLEKAAAHGHADAQRRLGALVLREADGLAETERALALLHAASRQGDGLAQALMASLVLPVEGFDDDEADRALVRIHVEDPWLAARMRLAREFGLTKLEALCVDVPDGRRPWGLVVGRNPFISQIRLAAPRAIPALHARAEAALAWASQWFAQASAARSHEGDLRKRSAAQRRLFVRLGLDERMFFARANAGTLDTLRTGTKWAWRARTPLASALSGARVLDTALDAPRA